MTKLLLKLFVPNNQNTDSSEVREKYGALSGIVGILLNILLSAGKFFAGIITNSVSIMADAANNLSDAGSSVITLVGFKMAGKPPSPRHPFGHGRIEYVSGLIVSIIIIVMGVELIKSSVEKIISPEQTLFSTMSIIILAVSVFVKLWMCIFNRKLAKMISSGTMYATAMDSLSDVAATSVVIIGALISARTGWMIDGYLGIMVALFIVYTGISTARESLSPLLGQAPSEEFVRKIYDLIMAHDNIIGIHDLIVHNYGPGRTIISLHAEVPCTLDAMEAHDIIDIVEMELKKTFNCDASIHMDPIAVNDDVIMAVKKSVAKLVSEIDTALSIHDFRMTMGFYHTNLIFDVTVPYNFKLTDDELIDLIKDNIHELDETYYAVITIDKGMVL